jgi:multidrug efflux pump subunit AcrA (membrane-fusion protein)
MRARMLVAGLGVAIAVVGAIAWLSTSSTIPSVSTSESVATSSGEIGLVELPPNKQQTAGIHTTTVGPRELREVRRVPGKIGYNTARRIEIKLPVGGVLTSLLAQQGQRVKQGQRLAVLTSAEVGLARTEVVSAEAEVELARKESLWADNIATNLADLQELLASEPAMTVVEKQFDDRLLGDHRDRVLSAYSKLLAAQRIWKSTEEVASSGGVSGILAEERRSAREVSAAHFKSALEQSLFDAAQQQTRANAALQRAVQLLSVGHQKLQLMLGPFAEIARPSGDAPQNATLCELNLLAPFEGVVEERLVTESVHTVAAQPLFALTNTDTLWVSAHIYDRQWSLLDDANLKELVVNAPAVPNRPVTARVLYAGVTTSVESGAVPLVAEFTNVDGHFKPGMFAWVSVPVGAPRQVLAVPLSAVTRHEQQSFVFVEEKRGTYRRVNVTLGPTSGEWVEVTAGLRTGQKIVDGGVFVLKSELLLGETDS